MKFTPVLKKVRPLGIFAVALILFAGMNMAWLVPAVQTLNAYASASSLDEAKYVAGVLSLHITTAVQTLSVAAEEISISEGTLEELEKIFNRILKRNNGFRSVSISDESGKEYFKVNRLEIIPKNSYLDHSVDPEFHRALLRKPVIGNVFVSKEYEPHLPVYFPVKRGQEVSSVLVGIYNLKSLLPLTKTLPSEKDSLYVVDKEGNQILHPDFTEVLKQKNLNDREIVKDVLLSKDSIGVFEKKYAYENSLGEKVYASGVYLPLTQWGIFIEHKASDLASQSLKFKILALMITAFGMLGVVVLSKSTIRLASLNKKLNTLLQENFLSAKLLIRKDRELFGANNTLIHVTRELNETGKILVKRDLALSEANIRLEGLDTVKSEFVSVAAHQLRTPLTGIRWSLQALLDGDAGALPAEQQRILSDSLTVTINATELINDLLDTARMEEGRFGFKLEKGDMLSLVQKVVTTLRPRADKKGISLSVSMPETMPDVYIDADKISIVIDNLINNSIKYTPPGGAISLTVRKLLKAIEVSVSDTGIGIPKEQQAQVFTQFFRAKNAKLFAPSGTGLGLYMVKNILDNHGGKVNFASNEGEGTTVSFTIPIKK